MSRIVEKLEHFANDIMADVGEERRILIEQTDKELHDQYDAKEIEYLKEAYELIQKSLIKIDQKKNESLSRIIMGNRVRLFEKRNELLNEIYQKVIDALKSFKKTDDYKVHLVRLIESSKQKLGPGEYSVKLDYSDKELVAFIEEATGLPVELESKKVQLIGGCIVQNRTNHTIVDNAFSKKLDNVKGEFVHQCQLEID